MYLEQRVEELEKQVEELKYLLSTKNSNNNNQKYRYSGKIEDFKFFNTGKTNNQKRKDLIKEAKNFVDNLKNHITNNNGYRLQTKYGTIDEEVSELIYDEVKFTVEYDKRKVTVELIEECITIYKESSRCLDYDVFNVHIGKAIALGKLLGLDVSKFTDAVQPSEVEVGHKVYLKEHNEAKYEVIKLIDKEESSYRISRLDSNMKATNRIGWDISDNLVIFDDTNAKY